ncbi:phage tail tape measure protein [Halomonas sp. MMSF_3323]|uniref:phage tail tape measure protein n=1 Tax=Halomonas sp. MMSF_3323 TaxID=3046701 RepID=UPI00273EB48C|nr:phage tail tape measure protein [Halomonas sp. MMSF_3323]
MANQKLNATIQIGGTVQRSFTSAIGRTKGKLGELGTAIAQAENRQRTLARSISTFGREGRNVDGLRRRYAELGDEIDRLRAKQQRLSRLKTSQDANLERRGELGGHLFGVAVAGAAMGAPLRAAMNFEAAMSRVGAVSRANDEQLARLTNTARELGATTEWSASQAAEGMQFLSMAGFSVDETVSAMPGMLNLASAAGTDLGRTADITSNVLRQFGMEADETGRLGDVLTNAFTTSNTTLESLGLTMSYVGPVAAAAGADIEQVAAMAGKLGDAGIQGEKAGTALRAMFSRLQDPPKEAGAILQGLGVSIENANGDMRDMSDILADMDTAMAGMGSVARSEILSTVFGLESLSAAHVLMADAASGALDEYEDSLHKAGTSAEVAAKQNDNARGMVKQLGSALESLAISVGNILLPAFTDSGNALAGMIRSVDTLIQEYPLLAKAVVGGTGAVVSATAAAVVGGYAYTFLKGGLLRTKEAYYAVGDAAKWAVGKIRAVSLASLLNPVGLAIAGIGVAVAGAAILIHRYWDPLTAFFSELWSSIEYSTRPAQRAFERVKEALAPIGNAIGGVIEWVERMVSPTTHAGDTFVAFADAGETAGRVIGWAINLAAWQIETAVDVIKYALRWNPIAIVTRNWEPIRDFFTELGEDMKAAIGDAVAWIGERFESIQRKWNAFKEFLGMGESAAASRELSHSLASTEAPSTASGVNDLPLPPDSLGTASMPIPDVAPRGGSTTSVRTQDTYEINVHQQPGEDSDDFAERVAERIEQKRLQSLRGALHDH